MNRRSTSASILTALALFAGCPQRAVTPAPPPSVEQQPPVSTDPLLGADGQHVAVARTWKGECAPAGSRGGCYSIALDPDGTFRHMLLDAAVTGTYVVDGDVVRLTPNGDIAPSTLPLSADRTRLGDYVYTPAVEP